MDDDEAFHILECELALDEAKSYHLSITESNILLTVVECEPCTSNMYFDDTYHSIFGINDSQTLAALKRFVGRHKFCYEIWQREIHGR